MYTKTCFRVNCSKKFTTEYLSKIYCSKQCSGTEQQRRSRIIILQKIHDFFKNKCAECGFNDVRALQIDHVNGGGSKELLPYPNRGAGSRLQYYRNVLKDIKSGRYQLLCANCNWIKRHQCNEK